MIHKTHIDLRQSPNYSQYMEKIGWRVERIAGCQIFIKRLTSLASIIKIQRPQKIPFKEIDKLAKKYRALFVKLEPQQWNNEIMKQLSHHGYKLSRSPLLPTKTLQIDLTLDEQQVFSQFKKDARYEIRKAEKNKLNILVSQYPNVLISDFISFWHKNAWIRGFWIPIKKQIRALWEAFGKDAYLIAACCSNDLNQWNKPIAGALIIIYDSVAYYSYATSAPEDRRLSAPYLVVWEAIKLAKKKGCRVFDFEGIYDERFPIKSWLGFSHFKKSFGGKEIEYPGCFTKFYNSILKFISKL